jgi:serine/threonine protein kinase
MGEQQEPLNPNEVLGGRFRIISEGVRRDVGVEFRAYDTRLDRLVAVLMVDRRFWAGAEILERLAEIRKRVAELNEPALLPIEHGGVIDGQLYLVRSRAEGLSLSHLLARTGPLETKAALEIAFRLCAAVAPAHRTGLVHGSVSPHSVFVADDGRVTVTDPGLFPALRPQRVQPGQPWGRFPYISPEQAAGLEVRPASDIYVIGSLIYEMLTGRPPFRSTDEHLLALQHLRSDPPSLQVLVPYVPLPVAQIVHKALAKEPAARYRNAGQLAYILRSQLGPAEASAPAPPPAPGDGVPSPLPFGPTGRPLVVPPPPLSAAYVSWPEGLQRRGPEAASKAEEGDGVDWLTIGLILGALLAVLGLIPLWRTVYRAYAVPESSPTPSSSRWAGGDVAWLLLAPVHLVGTWPEGAALQDAGPLCALEGKHRGLPPRRSPAGGEQSFRPEAIEPAWLDDF